MEMLREGYGYLAVLEQVEDTSTLHVSISRLIDRGHNTVKDTTKLTVTFPPSNEVIS